jgi:hypothetical protein
MHNIELQRVVFIRRFTVIFKLVLVTKYIFNTFNINFKCFYKLVIKPICLLMYRCVFNYLVIKFIHCLNNIINISLLFWKLCLIISSINIFVYRNLIFRHFKIKSIIFCINNRLFFNSRYKLLV